MQMVGTKKVLGEIVDNSVNFMELREEFKLWQAKIVSLRSREL